MEIIDFPEDYCALKVLPSYNGKKPGDTDSFGIGKSVTNGRIIRFLQGRGCVFVTVEVEKGLVETVKIAKAC